MSDLASALDDFYKKLLRAPKRQVAQYCATSIKCGIKPKKSDALAVHPKRRLEAMEHDKRAGVPTDYTLDGRPIITSRNHQKRLLKALGMHNNDGGFGD